MLWPVTLWFVTIDLIAAVVHWIRGGIDPITCLIQSYENKVSWGCNLMKIEIARWSAEAHTILDQNKWLFWVWVASAVFLVGFHIESYFVRNRIGDRKP